MTANANGAPSRATLAADLRFLRAALSDIPQVAARLLDDAIRRAEHDHAQALIWHGEACDRERAVAQLGRVREAVGRIALLLPADAEGEDWVLGQISEALDTERAGQPAATATAKETP